MGNWGKIKARPKGILMLTISKTRAMGLTFSKSVKAGPFRFNLSTSGIGFSTGIKGLRIGRGPRGTYISAGRGGFRYRTYLNPRSESRPIVEPSWQSASRNYRQDPEPNSHRVYLTELEKTDVSSLTDASSTELLNELNRRSKRMSFVKTIHLLMFIAIVGGSIVWLQSDSIMIAKAIVLTALFSYLPLWIIAYYLDLSRLQAVLMFDASECFQAAYQTLLNELQGVGGCAEIQCIRASGKISNHDQKYHAGASSEFRSASGRVGFHLPSRIKANLTPACLATDRNTFYFFPDRILVQGGDVFGSIPYDSFQFEVDMKQVIVERAPRDSKIVGKTWRYVNKNGGPDQRFANNPELLIVENSTLRMENAYGLHELFYFSQTSAATRMKNALEQFQSEIEALDEDVPEEKMSPQEDAVAEIYLGIGEQCFGPYAKAIVEEWVSTSQIEEGTLFWDEQREQWLPMAQFALEVNQ